MAAVSGAELQEAWQKIKKMGKLPEVRQLLPSFFMLTCPFTASSAASHAQATDVYSPHAHQDTATGHSALSECARVQLHRDALL
jgi:hypothetical protein